MGESPWKPWNERKPVCKIAGKKRIIFVNMHFGIGIISLLMKDRFNACFALHSRKREAGTKVPFQTIFHW